MPYNNGDLRYVIAEVVSGRLILWEVIKFTIIIIGLVTAALGSFVSAWLALERRRYLSAFGVLMLGSYIGFICLSLASLIAQ